MHQRVNPQIESCHSNSWCLKIPHWSGLIGSITSQYISKKKKLLIQTCAWQTTQTQFLLHSWYFHPWSSNKFLSVQFHLQRNKQLGMNVCCRFSKLCSSFVPPFPVKIQGGSCLIRSLTEQHIFTSQQKTFALIFDTYFLLCCIYEWSPSSDVVV